MDDRHFPVQINHVDREAHAQGVHTVGRDDPESLPGAKFEGPVPISPRSRTSECQQH